MPILEIEVTVGSGESLEPDSAQNLANAAGEVFGSSPGKTWVRLRTLPRGMYAENHTPLPELVSPVFVSVLKSEESDPEKRTEEIQALTEQISNVLNRPKENVHILYLSKAADRMAFGGQLVSGSTKENSRQKSEMSFSTEFKVDQIDHVEVFVPDRYQAAEWYSRILGVSIIPEFEHWAQNPQGSLMISSDNGSTKLALFQGEPSGSKPSNGFHLVAFRVGQAAFLEFLARLPDLDLTDHLGRQVTKALVADHDKSFSIYFSDPFGNHLEITSYDYDGIKEALPTLD